jgi:hypothetical protein
MQNSDNLIVPVPTGLDLREPMPLPPSGRLPISFSSLRSYFEGSATA